MDGGTARALSRQQQDVGTQSAPCWSQRQRGPFRVLPWSRAPTPTPSTLPRGACASSPRLVSGLLTAQAFPEHDVWWLAPVGVGLLSAAVLGARWRLALLLGLAHGLGFFLPTLLVDRGLRRQPPVDRPGHPRGALRRGHVRGPAVVQRAPARRPGSDPWRMPRCRWPGCCRSGPGARRRSAASRGPGSRSARPTARWPRWRASAERPGSPSPWPSLGVLLHLAARELTHRVGRPRRAQLAAHRPLGAVLAVLALAPLGLAVATTPPTDGRTVSVLFVQGNVPKPGLDFNAERRKVLDNHVAGHARRGRRPGHRARPTLVVWPENSSDIDPFRNADAARRHPARRRDGQGAAPGRRRPPRPGAASSRTPACSTGRASATPERYVKQHPVPFAEYIPLPRFFRNFSDKVDLVTQGLHPRRPARRVRGAGRGEQPYWIIPTICFEVAYDGLMRDSTLQPGRDASILAVQTNNATFGYTAESEQQFAISRLRAIEHGRSVVHVSTVGVSGFINPDGTYVDKTVVVHRSGPLRVAGGPHRGHPVRPAGPAAGVCRGAGLRRPPGTRPVAAAQDR